MIEEPPFSQGRSRIRDQKLSSPSKFANSKNGSNISTSNSVDLDFFEKIDLEKLSTVLSRYKKSNKNDEEENINSHSQTREKDKIKTIIHKFIKMKSFPISNPTLTNKLFQILQIILQSLSDIIFRDIDLQKSNEATISSQNSQDVKMVIGIQCPVCQKVFKSSYFIDKHITNKHPEHSLYWQYLKSPVQLLDTQNAKIQQNDEIEKVLKQIHKDLKKERRKSSVSIESRISNVETTMQNLGMIKPHPTTDNKVQHSRRHSSNSINITSLHTHNSNQRKGNESDYDSSYENDQNSKKQSIRRKINSKTDEYEYDDHSIKSARIEPSNSVHQPQLSVQTPNSARISQEQHPPQSPSNVKQQSARIQSSQSVPNTPSKIPKIPGCKPFIPNLQLQVLKSQGQLPQAQLQLAPQSEPKPKMKPQKPPQNPPQNPPVLNDQNQTENDVNDFSAEPRKSPQSSRGTPLRRPLPRKKPASLNVPSIQLDSENKTAVGQFFSPRNTSEKVDDLDFAATYQHPMSARLDSHTNNGFTPKKPVSSTPHAKRSIPFPSPKKPQTENLAMKVVSPSKSQPKSSSHPASPFTMIQVQSDEDDDNGDQNVCDDVDDGDEVSDEVCVKTQKVDDSQIEVKFKAAQKDDSSNNSLKKNDEKKNQLPPSSPVSISISKSNVVVDDDDDISEEYFDSVSSVSSESSEMPEIDFKPKPKISTNSQNSRNSADSRRKKRRKNDSNGKS